MVEVKAGHGADKLTWINNSLGIELDKQFLQFVKEFVDTAELPPVEVPPTRQEIQTMIQDMIRLAFERAKISI